MKIKNLFLILVICFISFFVSGCIKLDTEITIDKNGKVAITDKQLVSKQFLALASITSEDLYREHTKFLNGNTDIQASQIDEGDYTGIKFVSNYKNISNLSLIAKYFGPNIWNKDDYKYIKITKNIYNTNYYIDFDANFRDVKNDLGKRVFTPDTADYISSKLTINIPAKAKSSTATNILNDGLTHVWNFDVRNDYNVNLEFNVINYLNIVLSIIGLLSLIIGCVLKHLQLSEKAQKNLFGLSISLFIYFIVAQIVCSIQYLSLTACDIGIITVFVCLIAFTFASFLKVNINNNESLINEEEQIPTSDSTKTKICEYCGGEISYTAKKCRHCGDWLTVSGQKTNKNKSIQNKKSSYIKKIIDIFLRVALVILIIFAFMLSVNKYGDEHMDMIYNPIYEQNIFLKFIYTVDAFFYPPIPPI